MSKKLLLIPAALVWIALPAFGAHVLFGQSPVAHQIRPTTVKAQPDAPAAMRQGRELAPVEALNADLAARHAEFRVRAVEGTRAQFYEVS